MLSGSPFDVSTWPKRSPQQEGQPTWPMLLSRAHRPPLMKADDVSLLRVRVDVNACFSAFSRSAVRKKRKGGKRLESGAAKHRFSALNTFSHSLVSFPAFTLVKHRGFPCHVGQAEQNGRDSRPLRFLCPHALFQRVCAKWTALMPGGVSPQFASHSLQYLLPHSFPSCASKTFSRQSIFGRVCPIFIPMCPPCPILWAASRRLTSPAFYAPMDVASRQPIIGPLACDECGGRVAVSGKCSALLTAAVCAVPN